MIVDIINVITRLGHRTKLGDAVTGTTTARKFRLLIGKLSFTENLGPVQPINICRARLLGPFAITCAQTFQSYTSTRATCNVGN